MTFHDLVVRTAGNVGWITINRPDKHNSLRAQTFTELSTAFHTLARDDSVKVVVLTSAGDRAFSTGIDLAHDGLPGSTPEWDEHTRQNAEVLRQAWYLDKPLITAVNGYALAGGCNLALVGDLTVASETATFGEPEIRHGALSPLLLLPWLTNFKSYNYLYLTGDRIDASEALRMGLVNKVVPPEALVEAATALAERVANAPGYALSLAKRAVRLTLDGMGFHAAQQAHRYVDTMLLGSHGVTEKEQLMNVLDSQGMRAFLDARDRPYGER
jgi:enoyl-CoA hydratase/carnithine racemase